MNYRMICRALGAALCLVGACMLLPLIVALIYHDPVMPFVLPILLYALVGGALLLFFRPKNKTFYAKEGFFIVAVAWIAVSAIGCLPFVLAHNASYVDAFFETVSGFTTTGATIFGDVEKLSHSILFWRSFTHWIGGMGVLVLMLAILPGSNERSMHLARAEMAGPSVSKTAPRMRSAALSLYVLYGVLTVLEILLLLAGGMPFFDSVVNSFATAGTGGFAIKGISIGAYQSYFCQWVIAVFMLLFGMDFGIYFLLIGRQFREIFTNEELRVYLAIVGSATLIITVNLLMSGTGFGRALTDAFFQVTSVISTTGFSTANFDLWPTLSKTVLFLLMFIGGCVGSTAGSIKVQRFIILCKNSGSYITHSIHPRSVNPPRVNGKTLDDELVSGTTLFFSLFMFIIAVGALLISLDGYDLLTTITASVTCMCNVGPGFGELVGPMGNFSCFSAFSKIVLSLMMLLGRLEIFPLLICFSPRMYTRRVLKKD